MCVNVHMRVRVRLRLQAHHGSVAIGEGVVSAQPLVRGGHGHHLTLPLRTPVYTAAQRSTKPSLATAECATCCPTRTPRRRIWPGTITSACPLTKSAAGKRQKSV